MRYHPVIALILLTLASSASARILNVPDDFQTIQAAINDSQDGDTVLVQPGVYQENLVIHGTNPVIGSLILTTGDPAYIDSTVIDGRNQGSTVTINAQVHLRGFTITNGSGTGQFHQGGGIYGGGGSILEDLHITENHAGEGGGIFTGSDILRRVRIDSNVAQNMGGGGCFEGLAPQLINCIINNNQAERYGGLVFYESDPMLRYVSVVDNRATGQGNGMIGGIALFGGGNQNPIVFDHVTIARNRSDERQWSGGIHMSSVGNGLQLTNSIIYDNDGDHEIVEYDGDDGGEACRLSVGYSDIQGGENAIWVVGISEMTWLDGNITTDPLFVDPDHGDYHLTANSPCRDSGDPDAAPDPDGSRADMGAFPFIAPAPNVFFGGQVLDSISGDPIAHATVLATERIGFGMNYESDANGIWGGWRFLQFPDSMLMLSLTVSAPGYMHSEQHADLAPGDSLWIVTRLGRADFLPNSDSLLFEVDSGGFAQLPLTFSNTGNGPVAWQAAGHSIGDAGLPYWSQRQSYAVADSTHDNRIEGAIYANGNFYLCGSNGLDSNLVYVLNRDGSLVHSFGQCGNSHYGFKDLEWDGNLIWASGEQTVYGFTPDGQVSLSWQAPYNPTNDLAWDSDHGVFWLSGTTTNISACDMNGNVVGSPLNRKALRFYGLAYWPNDPDGYKLYLVDEPGNGLGTRIYKMNTNTGDTMLVQAIPHTEGSVGMNGAFITNQFDEFGSWVMLTIDNIAPADGGDQLRIFQLQPNNEWLTVSPDSGEVAAEGQSQVMVTVRTTAEHGDWSFKPGEYDGEIVITHDAIEGQTIVPVHLIVRPPNTIGFKPDAGSPAEFGITAAYPQPFNGELTVGYRLDRAGEASLTLRDINGREVGSFLRGNLPVGDHRATLNLNSLPSGVYLVRLESAGRQAVSKVVLMK